MSTRINTQDADLFCSVSCNPSEFQDSFNSSEECLADLKPLILADCQSRGYSEDETEKVLTHYSIVFNNANGTWNNAY